jgi:CBS domain-containing protein
MTVKTKGEPQVGQIMTRNPVCVTPATPVHELARILEANEISGVPVVDALERIIGVVSRTDLLRRCVEGPEGSRPGQFERRAGGLAEGTSTHPDDMGTVEDLMNPEPITALADEPAAAVAHRMAEERVHRIVVIDPDRHVEGIVTSLDLLRVFPG